MAGSLKRIALHALRTAIGGIFVFAGIVKIWDFKGADWATQQFATAVQNYHLTSWTVSIIVAVYLPWLELIAGAALILRKCEAGALVLLTSLTLGFLGALSSAWMRGLDIDCGCFGKANFAHSLPSHLAGDLVLLIGFSILGWAESRRLGASPILRPAEGESSSSPEPSSPEL